MPHKKSNTRAKGLAADQPDLCYLCHDKATFTKKSVHAAVAIGCTSCHSPHSADNAKLLITTQPDLCYTCHNKEKFVRKDVHAALGMGCTNCHNPHATERTKLLVSEQPDLCYACHDKAMFTKRNVHAALAGGCGGCHDPHATDERALLVKKPLLVCLECHDDVMNRPHLDVSLASAGHPFLGDVVGKQPGGPKLRNPAQGDKPFYCGSCHDPHSTDSPKLFRFNAASAKEMCVNCHAM
jgi:predicted CXXCH cytochrome family protein